MHKQTTLISRTLIAPLVFLAPAIGFAQVDTSDWKCESCPFEKGYRAEVDAGATHVGKDGAIRFGNATGYDDKGGYVNVDGHGRYAADGYRIDWTIEDLGLDSRVFELDGGRQGTFGFHVGYRELPYRRFDTTRTVFNPSYSDTITLPDTWQPAGLTSNMTQLSSSLRRQIIGSDRQIIDIGADWMPARDFRVFADFRRQNRDGIDITGGSSFTQAALLPRWLDYETDQIDAGVQYGTNRASVTLAYYGSFFTNQNPSLTWDTPFISAQYRMAMAPDNDFQQISLSGAYRATMWDTVVAFTLASGSGEQNEPLLPYTISTIVGASSLPISSLDAEVDTANYALTLTSRPLPNGRIKLAYRLDERDNKALQSDWTRVITDLAPFGQVEQNVPYSFERSTITLSGELVVWKDIRVSAGGERKKIKRDFQEVAEQTIDAGWGQVRWRPLAWLDLRVKGGATERDIDRYDETIAISLGQNPLMRKYYLAYRYRSYGELIASITPVDWPVSFGTTFLYADDRYNKSQLGITDSEEVRATVDLNWAISDKSSLYLVYGHDNIDALQLGSEQFRVWDWSARHDDNFDHFGAGFHWSPPEGKYKLRLDYDRSDGETSIELFSLSGGQSRLPDLTSTLDSARVEASYQWNERLDATLDLRYERFKVDDYTLVSPATIPTVLTLGAQAYDYDVWALGLGIRYRFGGGDISLAD
ncbi:MAG: MtrB/PioB family decaheme-associated outer membrane protein [Gammaproteobacteria bacterium]|nr:MtrB/PioB family decaheme-associated outer membrane protein [Gammaproteobacteria bacterium]MDH3363576.1 MtrB/PioB family decaheme-associated outer membrane protein [Gammaproteobacteria bacterium]MDH3480803.1 MtrB/PioB family decaheme-associated outer membrane protein [Gammaproteobacteria bacterium]